ncbi:metallophosphoesterase [Roseomonas sp. OT10]|uniref:metallophosphoesterase family protein n=1 Tax=Roseomonas cutis TaxID=2897332 RepID=UPI001E53FA59|nr:metallophosphoesterase [Roseomonas sp. OT10]UFN50397.1 metallophosphoesterase [Roseomonas sp. OT10]
MRRIDHISDLHFNRIDPAATAALLDRLNEDPADLVAVSGDLTMRARRREYAAAAEFLRALRAPWIAVPGNHDITAYWPWERFLVPFGRWQEAVGATTEPDWIDPEIAVLGLNTVSRGGLWHSWADGAVHRRALLRLLRRLRGLPRGPVRIVLAHHPFLAPSWAPETTLVRGAPRALRALARSGVRLILAGHLHRGYVSDFDVAATHRHRLTVLQAGSATSLRLRGEANAYNRIIVEAGNVSWTVSRWTGTAWMEAA